MKDYLSDVSYVMIDEMHVISSVAFGVEPEEEVINRLEKLAMTYDLSVKRAFGFDVPVEGCHDMESYRGYEYWLVVDDVELTKLPSGSFTYDDAEILVKEIPGFRYATITIDKPFAAPFERIPGGFRALMSWLETHDYADPDFKPLKANCLEELIEKEQVMHIYIPVDRL